MLPEDRADSPMASRLLASLPPGATFIKRILSMTQVPQKPLVPNGTLITKTAEEGRALAIMLARNSIHAMQGELETLKSGRAQYAHDPHELIAASHVVAVEFATVAAANAYWR